MLPCVQAHFEMLGKNDIPGRVFVPVLPVKLPDITPVCRTMFLSRAPVLPAGIIKTNGTQIDGH